MTDLSFDKIPSLANVYVRAITARKPRFRDAEIPRFDARVNGVQLNPNDVNEYAKVCGFSDTSHALWAYPHVLAAPIHGQIISHPDFPLPALGLVHVRQSISVTRPLKVGESFDIHVFVEGHHEAKNGVEFELVTRFLQGDKVAWEGVTTILHRTKSSSKSKRREVIYGTEPGSERSVVVRVPTDMGRQYAAVSGDYNPIHLFPLSAKAFGFKRHIVHGMWTLARVVAELGDGLPETGSLETRFIRPVFLPSRIVIASQSGPEKTEFQVHSSDGKSAHALGSISAT